MGPGRSIEPSLRCPRAGGTDSGRHVPRQNFLTFRFWPMRRQVHPVQPLSLAFDCGRSVSGEPPRDTARLLEQVIQRRSAVQVCSVLPEQGSRLIVTFAAQEPLQLLAKACEDARLLFHSRQQLHVRLHEDLCALVTCVSLLSEADVAQHEASNRSLGDAKRNEVFNVLFEQLMQRPFALRGGSLGWLPLGRLAVRLGGFMTPGPPAEPGLDPLALLQSKAR
eukprot:scaffold7066_cov253-Pinguiococcus_pyrenoidosus.AAC.12